MRHTLVVSAMILFTTATLHAQNPLPADTADSSRNVITASKRIPPATEKDGRKIFDFRGYVKYLQTTNFAPYTDIYDAHPRQPGR